VYHPRNGAFYSLYFPRSAFRNFVAACFDKFNSIRMSEIFLTARQRNKMTETIPLESMARAVCD
jgi:hypothetical protein